MRKKDIETREADLELRETEVAQREAELALRESEADEQVQEKRKHLTMTVFCAIAAVSLAAIFYNTVISRGAGRNDASLPNSAYATQNTVYGGQASSSPNGADVTAGNQGGCCGSGEIFTLEQAKAWGIAYYARKYGDKDVTAKAEDFGCHKQVNIYKNGKLLMKLAVRGETDIQEL